MLSSCVLGEMIETIEDGLQVYVIFEKQNDVFVCEMVQKESELGTGVNFI